MCLPCGAAKALVPRSHVYSGTKICGYELYDTAGWEAPVESMDIIASILAYLVCMTGLVTGLVMWFVVFFSTPGQQSQAPSSAIAMATRASSAAPVKKLAIKEFPVKTVVTRQGNPRNRFASDAAAAQAAIAPDAQQKPLLSQSRMRRLAEKQRARQLAYRERSSFEARFLHYDD